MAAAPIVTTPPIALYVGDLPPDATEDHLKEIFKDFPSMVSVRVCRDSQTGRSLRYGYTNFLNAKDALQAITTKNHSLLNGKQIRVMWANRDPGSRKSGIGNVFVKNLCESIDNVRLQDLFSKFGYILSCKVNKYDDGKSKGHGFVQFDNEDSAVAAIQSMNGTTIGDKQLFVSKFIGKYERMKTSDVKFTNLYVKNLDPSVNEELLREKFSVFGNISSLAIAKNESGKPRGFVFVNYDNPDDAKRAVEGMNGSELGSQILYVARAQKAVERKQILKHQYEEKRKEKIKKYKNSNVYIKNIDDDVTEEELKEHFSQCGTITSVKLMTNDKGINKGFGFVCFSTPEEAYSAVNTFNGSMFHRKPLYVSIAQRKEDRQAHLQQLHHMHRLSGLSAPSASVGTAGGYSPFYYSAPPSGVVPQVPSGPGLLYPSPGFRPDWRVNGFATSSRPPFQPPSPLPIHPNACRHHRPNRGRMNGHILPSVSHLQQQLPLMYPKDSTNQQRNGQSKYLPNGRVRDTNRGSSGFSSHLHHPQGLEILSSMLSAASPQNQKRMLGDRLFPMVSKYQPDLASKITGMLLDMDNAELLLLLESPDSLVTKVKEAVEVLKSVSESNSNSNSNSKSNNSPIHLSAEVAVN
ncbi:polyadenylate-binding protein 7 [Cannabis sativa]|uniref:polyadenylate-binding protein 7 n=1 Tax=Cannabis sativa TaxID=3483 RepID=UPI0011E05DF0|nr:polyadenylate-binding protein 7 [Cannabis sativa]